MLNHEHASIAVMPEAELIARLMRYPYLLCDLVQVHGIPDGCQHRLSVPLGELTGPYQGDVDILLSVPGAHQEATAIEVKRVKYSGAPLKRNKLNSLAKGVDQANRLASLRFWQVYLYVIVVVDSRLQNAGKLTYDGLSLEMAQDLEEAISPFGLDERVGMIHLDYEQPMDCEPLTCGAGGARVIRLARAAAQRNEVTAWVAAQFSN